MNFVSKLNDYARNFEIVLQKNNNGGYTRGLVLFNDIKIPNVSLETTISMTDIYAILNFTCFQQRKKLKSGIWLFFSLSNSDLFIVNSQGKADYEEYMCTG